MKQTIFSKSSVIRFVIVTVLTAFFMLEFNTVPWGPYNVEEKDDLGITNAFYDKNRRDLILQTPSHWARVSIKKVVRANKKLKYLDPVSGNTLNWRSFKKGALSQKITSSMEPVPVRTNYTARLVTDPDRPIWPSQEDVSENKVKVLNETVPSGDGFALYHLSNGNGLKGYLLVTPTVNADGRGGVQFYYDPGAKIQVTLRHPFALVIFGFSYVGLLLVTVCSFQQQLSNAASAMLKLSLVLHAFSCGIIYVGTGVGQAWSGQSNAMDGVITYIAGGVVLNFAIYIWGRSFEVKRRGNGTGY